MEKKEQFQKIIDDFTKDLILSYPEMETNFDVINYDEYFEYCTKIYPENFFHILYENTELFDNEENKYLLPNIDFKVIMEDESLSEQSKKMIWKYIQLILFSVCNDIHDKDKFGDANMLFEAIEENDLHQKIEHTMNEMKDLFSNMMNPNSDDISGMDNNLNKMFETMMGDASFVEGMFNQDSSNETADVSGKNPFENMMDADKMKEHLSGIMDGKIGSLAKEIAEEASKELGIDNESMDEKSQQDFLKNIFKNPTKLMDIVKNIGSKLEEKFKSGDLKESELLEEAQGIMDKMKDMPGLKEMMSSMGMNPGGKMDFKGMANRMQQNMKQAKMKERMRTKLNKNQSAQKQNDESLGNFTQVEKDTFVWTDENSQCTPVKKSSSKTSNPSKKKSKGKKNKQKKKNN